MRAIRRTKTVEGTSIPGIIHNGGSYFYINVDVYEDGMVNCWELTDLKGLSGKNKFRLVNAGSPLREAAVHSWTGCVYGRVGEVDLQRCKLLPAYSGNSEPAESGPYEYL
ncbi:hypothetical protein ACFSQ7_20480 [Paenibacillus rhizoplanae]